MLASITPDVLLRVGTYVVCLVLSVAVHEYFHALVASRLGDPTPEHEDRLTLNPISHIDVIGTLVLPVVAALGSLPLIGWGKPVPTQPQHYTRRISMRGGLALVSAAGPLGNLVLAAVVLAVALVLGLAGVMSAATAELLQTLLRLNILLMVFNLLPLHPLDGGKILAAFLPPRLEYIDEYLVRYGGYILIALIVVGGRFLFWILSPFLMFSNGLWKAVVG